MIHSHPFDAQQATPASLTSVILSEAKNLQFARAAIKP
jgi:hypothetical protein